MIENTRDSRKRPMPQKREEEKTNAKKTVTALHVLLASQSCWMLDGNDHETRNAGNAPSAHPLSRTLVCIVGGRADKLHPPSSSRCRRRNDSQIRDGA